MSKNTLASFHFTNSCRQTGRWLTDMLRQGLLTRPEQAAGLEHFGLKPGLAEWRLFVERLFTLLGVLLMAAGLIFFVAWNWEDMPRLAKFAIAETAFALCALWSLWRWNKSWDARPALFGAALITGALLALYGQTYQTGADAWELFRAWALALLPLALAGRATAFWFLLWLVVSLWCGLYLIQSYPPGFWEDSPYILWQLAGQQMVFLILAEALGKLPGRLGAFAAEKRALTRIIGYATVTLGTACMIWGIAQSANRWSYYDDVFFLAYGGINSIIYLACICAMLLWYYKAAPDLPMLAVNIFSLAGVAGTWLCVSIVESAGMDVTVLLPMGAVIIGLTFGAVRAVLVLRKRINARTGPAKNEGLPQAQSLTLRKWLLENTNVTPEEFDNFMAAWQEASNRSEPWFSKIFSIIGIWLGALCILGFLSFAVFTALDSSGFGVLGLMLCGASIAMSRGSSLWMRQCSQICAVCGLAYSSGLTGLGHGTAVLLALLFIIFWLFKPEPFSRCLSFLGALICLLWQLSLDGWHSYRYEPTDGPDVFMIMRLALFTLCGLFALYALTRAPERQKKEKTKSSPLPQPDGLLPSAGLACCIYCAACVFALDLPGYHDVIPHAPYALGLTLIYALALAMLWRERPQTRPLLMAAAPVLLAAAYFMPAAGAGLVLLLVARNTGSTAIFGLAISYLGAAIFVSYYNLHVTLLQKSALLAATGFALLLTGTVVRFLPLARPSRNGVGHEL